MDTIFDITFFVLALTAAILLARYKRGSRQPGVPFIDCRAARDDHGAKTRFGAVALATLSSALMNAASAAAATIDFTKTDIGGPSGTSAWNSGTGVLQSSGTGIGGTSDSFTFVQMPAAGNVEVVSKVSSPGAVSAYEVAGVMVRSSLSANSAMAFVSSSPSWTGGRTNGVNFMARTADGAVATKQLGPSNVPPLYLRLVISGSDIAGYQSADGSNWSLVGKTQIVLPAAFYVGIAGSSTVNGTLTSATFAPHVYVGVPQRNADMQLWLRADAGVVADGSSKVSKWQDQSQVAANASQTTTANQPTFSQSNSTANYLPTVGFASSSAQFLNLGGSPNLTGGLTYFVVCNPSTIVLNGALLAYSTNTSNYVNLQEYTGGEPRLWVTNAGASGGVVATSAMDLNQFQVITCTHDVSRTVSFYKNGTAIGTTGTTNLFAQTSPTTNFIAKHAAAATYFNGSIAEMLVFKGVVASSDRVQIENYLRTKYAISAPTLAAPTISTGAIRVVSTPQDVTITAPVGSVALYTTDGSTPSLGSGSTKVYTTPIHVDATTTINAIAVAAGFNTSAIATSVITFDTTASNQNVLLPTLQLWLRADLGVTASGTTVTKWADVSGNANDATPSGSPTLVTNDINSLPAISFNGTNQYFSVPSSSAYTSGTTIFVVAKPTTLAAGKRLVDFGSGTTTNSFNLQEAASSGLAFVNFNNTTSTTVSQTGVLTSSYKILSAVYDGINSASIYSNSALQATNNAMNAMVNTTRTTNSIGRLGNNSAFFAGNIAEVLVYNTALSPIQRLGVEGMLSQKYGLYAAQTVDAPYFSITSGTTFGQPSQVAINAPAGADIRFTTDGSTPTTSASLYTGPLTVGFTQTIKAIAVKNSVSSAVSTASYTLDATKFPAPNGSDNTAPRINLQLPTPAL